MEALRDEGEGHMALTAYQGVEVIATEVVPVRHPRWGYEKLTVLKDASLLLLADETALVVCNECQYNGITGRQPYKMPEGKYLSIIKQADAVMSHLAGTHWRSTPRGSMYTDNQIKVMIKVWLKWSTTGVKNWGQSACSELDRLGFKPFRMDTWNPSALGGLVRIYRKLDRFKNIKAGPVSQEDREDLAKMVREVAAREGAGKASVASTARITEARPQTAERQEENGVSPKLSFTVPGEGATEPTPTRTIQMPPEKVGKSIPAMVMPPVELVTSDYEFIVELEDGTPMFRYKGVLMVGKKVKNIEI